MIYFLKRSDGLVKIGTTDNFKARYTQLRAQYGELEILGVMAGSYEEERALHFKFGDVRHGESEFFASSPELMSYIKEKTSDVVEQVALRKAAFEERLSEIRLKINQHLKRQWDDVLIIGELALEAKQLVPHGQFRDWIASELGLSSRLIQGYMRVYERFSKREKFASRIPVSGLLMLASPSVPDTVIAEIEIRIDDGEKISLETIEGVIDRYRVLEGAQIGSVALLQNYGSKSDGTPARNIPRSAITSLEAMATEGLSRGVVTIDGEDRRLDYTFPQTILIAVEQETRRRQSEHIDDYLNAHPQMKEASVKPQMITIYKGDPERTLKMLRNAIGDEVYAIRDLLLRD